MPRVNGYSPGGGASPGASAARYTGFSGSPLSVVGSGDGSGAWSGAVLAIRLHELGQDATQALRVHEPDAGPVRAGPRRLIEQLGAGRPGLGERRTDVIGRIGDVMHRLAAILQELLHLGRRAQRADQLDTAFPDGDHGDLDTLGLEPLAASRPKAKPSLVELDRLVEI